MSVSRTRAALLAGLAAAALLSAHPAAAQPAQVRIEAGPLEPALLALAHQTGEQLLFSPDLVAGRRAPAVIGTFTAEQALSRLLAGSGILVHRAGPAVLVLKAKGGTATAAGPARALEAARPFAGEAGGAPPGAPPSQREPPPQTASTVSEIQVTGTHIRGAGSVASPLIVMDAEDLQRSGQATLAQAINLLPQNYSGENTEASVTTRANRLGNNLTFASGVNLRGLGPSATLVLVNGRRIAPSGNKGDFVDLSLIPTAAVERVEILLDGASAIYGSDAVAGVVNVILKRDFDGGELRIRGGAAPAGGAEEALAGLVLGRTWATGNLLAAVEVSAREPLAAAERDYTRSADLRRFGGSDFRSPSAYPGNILGLDPATGVSGPLWAVPRGQDGLGLRPTDFTRGDINLASLQQGVDMLPRQRLGSAYAAFRQEIGERHEVSGDASYTLRTADARIAASTTTLTVTGANPFFVSPVGAASHQIQYSFAGELPAPLSRSTAQSLTASLGARLSLPGRWGADAYAAFGQQIDSLVTEGLANTAILAEALGNVPDSAATAYSPSRDGWFNPFTGQPHNPAAVRAAIGSGFTHTRGRSRIEAGNLQLDGPLFELAGGEIKLAVGGNLREESFARIGTNFLSTGAPIPQAPVSGRRTVSAAFAEVLVPLAGPQNGRPGLRALELSGAVRFERYSDFGDTLNPKLGLAWTPFEGLRLRASWGESFRAPGLAELKSPQIFQALQFPSGSSARVLSLVLTGGNEGLQPETAETFTAGVDWRPAWAPGLRLSASWFETVFDNRIDRPVTQNLAGALLDTRFTPFVRRVQPATDAADLALVSALLDQPAADRIRGLNPVTAYGAVVDIRAVNTGGLTVSGLDIQASWTTRAFGGDLSLGLTGSQLLDYIQSLTPTSPGIELAGLATYPADLRLRATADWTRGPLSLGAAVNHLSGFDDAGGRPIDSHTTLDLQAKLAAPTGRFEGTTLSLFVRNVFDTPPPFYDNPFGYAFDPSNADIIGRFVAVQLTRRW
ncbi:TonB-dependent receptor [Phenylobacterium sp.]|uniref:TonB-dependent receptor n=1 Tax=Phenylobacterium sp. TaxID=1871053 RepID=UPI002E378755|nr:TonB-dependent receptor [Phenylobacterium sp.]HEX2558935.1 TonB-dependent receptor [Phenylobacterium sp.]